MAATHARRQAVGSIRALSERRLSRRRALAGAAALGLGAAATGLVGCKGGSDGSNGRSAEDSVIYAWQLPDETKDAVPGGVYRSISTGDTASLDPFTSGDFVTQTVAGTVYETLLGWQSGPGLDPSIERDFEGRAAQSFEATADAMTFTFRMRPGVHFQSVPPVNGRVMEIEDWRQSLTRFLATSTYRANLRAILDKVEYPDDRTMVLKLKSPYAPAARLFTSGTASFYVLPKESSDGPMDAKNTAIGTNYRQLDKFQPSITWEYRKHTEYWRKDRPFIDRWHYPIIPEYANRYAQFIAGNVLEYSPRQTDVLLARKDVPTARMFRTNVGTGFGLIYFGKKDYASAPWHDERVRQALSMMYDRGAMRAYFSNSAEFEGAGLPIETRWHSHIPGSRTLFWLDPAKGSLGDVSRYFKHDPAEAKKLFAAAGFPDGLGKQETYFTTPAVLGSEHPERVEITFDAWNKTNLISVSRNNLPYELAYRDYYWTRNFSGIAITPVNTAVDVDLEIYQLYHSKGSLSLMNEDDPKVDQLIEKQRVELDTDRRVALLQEFQKYMAQKMYAIPWDGTSSGFTFRSPFIHNSAWPAWNEWLDPKMPGRAG